MDIFKAKEKIRQVTEEIIESVPHSDLGILADHLIGALTDQINLHIDDPDDYVIYDIY